MKGHSILNRAESKMYFSPEFWDQNRTHMKIKCQGLVVNIKNKKKLIRNIIETMIDNYFKFYNDFRRVRSNNIKKRSKGNPLELRPISPYLNGLFFNWED